MTRTTLAAALASLLAGAPAYAGDVLPADQPVTLNGIEVACTGVGDEAQADPRWPAFAARIEFANAAAEYLSDVDVTIADAKGETLVEARCDSPWFLAKLPPGKYLVSGTFEGHESTTAKFTAPKSGQARIVVRFPNL